MVESEQNTVQDLEHITDVLTYQPWEHDRNLTSSMLIWKHAFDPLFDPKYVSGRTPKGIRPERIHSGF